MTEKAKEFTAKLISLLGEYDASIDITSDNGVDVDLYVENEIITLDECPNYRFEIDKDTTFKPGMPY